MIYFQNPDRQWYKKTISQWVRDKMAMNKYEYLLDYHLSIGVVNVILPITGKNKLSRSMSILLRFVRFYLWLKINRLSYKHFNVLYDYEQLTSKDTVFSFFHDNFASTPICCNKNEYEEMLISARCKFLLHLNHYVYDVKRGSLLCSKIKNIMFIAETNLIRHSEFFRKYFSWYKKDIKILPFCVQDRFKRRLKIKKNNRAVATGAITFRIDDSDFKNFFGTDLLQPQRKYILENDRFLEDVDVSISEYKHLINNSFLSSLAKKIFNKFPKFNPTSKKGFYEIDIVDHYNSYDFVVCPAEIIGLPGIGAFEAMACGAILIDDENNFYEDYNFIPGEHYVTYDGTSEDLQKKIKDLISNTELAKRIRMNSLDIINSTMRKCHCIKLFSRYAAIENIKSEI